ncbi:cobalamin-dependent protein [Pseudalgibacter alginicilyticus]|uniref:cobalamin-dependent protein n=1 Tax=Pseudalgibacter alginicilyticus TaxID=1736674 RepID=UPI000A4FDAAB
MYNSKLKNDDSYKKAQKLADVFAEQDGRRPRIMISKMKQDYLVQNTKVLATTFAHIGFDVDIAPLFETPQEITKQAIENDVHILSLSVSATNYKILIPQVISGLKKYGREDIMIIVGSTIPKQDYKFLFDAGVATIFNPDEDINKTAIEILTILVGL